MNKYAMIAAVLIVFIMIVPQYAKASTQVEETETVDIQPESDDYDEIVNVANDTTRMNIDTWDPLPEGIFVGGNTEESKLRLSEYSTGTYTQLLLATKVQFQRDYIMSGASDLWVRLPIAVDEYQPCTLQFYIFEIRSGTYAITARGPTTPTADIGDASILQANGSDLRAVFSMTDVADYASGAIGPAMVPGTPNSLPTQESFVRDGRVYVHARAPLSVDSSYLFVMRAVYDYGANHGQAFDMYFSPSDLASDGILESHIAYYYYTNPASYRFVDTPIAADLGWSFVFQEGLGNKAISVDNYVIPGDKMIFWRLVHVASVTANGSLNFDFQFNLLAGESVEYSLNISVATPFGTFCMINGTYWNNMVTNHTILASNPNNITYPAVLIGGHYYIFFIIDITFTSAAHIQFIMYDDESCPSVKVDNSTIALFTMNNYMMLIPGAGVLSGVGPSAYYTFGGNLKEYFFSPWASLSIDKYTMNKSMLPDESSKPFIIGGAGWYSDPFFDFLAGIVVLPFELLDLTTGGVFGATDFAHGVLNWVYGVYSVIRDAPGAFLRMVIDFATGIGVWLWKVAQGIWAILTWFIDALIDFGAVVLAIIIYALALIVPILMIYYTVKMMQVFLKMSKGDLEGAASEVREVISDAKGMVGK